MEMIKQHPKNQEIRVDHRLTSFPMQHLSFASASKFFKTKKKCFDADNTRCAVLESSSLSPQADGLCEEFVILLKKDGVCLRAEWRDFRK